MIARLGASVATILATTTLALATPPFAPVGDGFEGTRFRGIALGQSRTEVEAALAANNFRCLSDEEYPYGPDENAGYTICPIVRSDFVLDEVSRFTLMVRYDFGNKLGLPYHAVSFVNDVASAITLDPDYFNASGTTPFNFAEQIVTNYDIIEGMAPYGSGWRGATNNDEIILVHTFPIMNTHSALLVVTMATEATTPSFD